MPSTLIRGGRVVDGAGNPWKNADVALEDGRIRAIAPPGRLEPANHAEVVDAAAHVVAPGFIDIQSHSILPLMVDPRCLSKITQGVTTEVMGEGWTPAPFGGRIPAPIPSGSHPAGWDTRQLKEWEERAAGWRRFGDWLDAFVERGVSPNVGSFLGGGTLRQYACGMDAEAATPEQVETMRRVAAEAMESGAFGVAYALIYPPDTFATTDEIVEVCKVVGRAGGVYICHMRSEGDQLFEALEETFEIGRRADLAVEIYHLKAAGRSNWHKVPELLERIDRARAGGLDVTADMYPYVGSGTGLASVLPPWAAAGGRFYENLRDPAMRARIRAEAQSPSGGWEPLGHRAGPEGVMPIGFRKPENQQYVGKRLTEIAEMRRQDWIDAAIDLLADEGQRIFTIYFVIDEANIPVQLRQPWIKVSTDAGGMDPAWAAGDGPTHPRAYGTYTRVLGKYVREEGAITLEDAVRKMSGAVADRLRLTDRGYLREGLAADVVVFDPATVADRATFEESHRLSVGVRDVWVNGVRVLAGGQHTGATPGRFVRPG